MPQPDTSRAARPESPPGGATNRTHLRLLTSAVQLFAERGFHGIGIRDLARAAGISTSSLYHYMGTKEVLLFEIMHDALGKLLRAAEAIEAEHLDPGERLAAFVRMHVVTHAVQRSASIVVDNELDALAEDDRKVIVAQRDAYEAYWGRAIRDGIAAKQFSVPDPTVTRICLLEMCSGVARWFSSSGTQSIDQIAEAYVRIASGMLDVPAEAPDWTRASEQFDVRALVEDVWAIPVPSKAKTPR